MSKFHGHKNLLKTQHKI